MSNVDEVIQAFADLAEAINIVAAAVSNVFHELVIALRGMSKTWLAYQASVLYPVLTKRQKHLMRHGRWRTRKKWENKAMRKWKAFAGMYLKAGKEARL